MRPKPVLIGLLALAIALAAIAAWSWRRAADRRFRAELTEATRELDQGLLGTAWKRLTRLESEHPGDPEVAYLLGRCEATRGRLEAALDAWSRIPPDAPQATAAAVDAAHAAVLLGRLATAERFLHPALHATGPQAAEARHLLLTILGQQGRTHEARRLIESAWDHATAAPGDGNARLGLLREHVGLDLEPFPLEFNLALMEEKAENPTGDDDRMALALARAHLATRAGDFDRADGLLREWLGRRPDDPLLWRARLDWAIATRQTAPAREAMTHVPARQVAPSRIPELRAWLARQGGDRAAERRALEALVARDPGHPEALARLAELAQQTGNTEAAARLRQRKAGLDTAIDRYLRLYRENKYSEHLAELAGLAGRLGRRFEERGFRELAGHGSESARGTGEDPSQPPSDEPAPTASATLADLVEPGVTSPAGATGQSLPASPQPARRHAPRFDDEAAAAGLADFIQDNGASPIHQLPEMSSGGVGLLDYDGDGFLDVYCVQGGHFPPATTAGTLEGSAGDRLYHNRGDGTFEDVTARSGIGAMPKAYGHGVAVGDYDNDGRPDLFITRWRSYALYHNRGDGTFEDITAAAGLGGDRDWPTSSAFADLDGDGDLDLYVCHYGEWDPSNPLICKDQSGTKVVACDPRRIRALPDHAFRNDAGRFVDVTTEAGFVDRDGRGLGVVAADLDEDGRVDLFVANDSTANYLYHNLGNFRFEEVGHEAGVAANAGGGYQAGMGVACGDADGDGRLDLAVTNFYGESTTLFRNLGGGLFADHTAAAGLAAPSRYRLGFGIAFLDADSDGWLDLMTANGHVSDERPLFPYAMPPQLFQGGPGGRLVDVTAEAGPPFQRSFVGRGLAVGDLDNDGRPDALLIAQNEPIVYLRNRTQATAAHFVALQLEGTRSNHDGVGARVTVRAGGRDRVAVRAGGGSFQSAGDPRLHFGLGTCDRVDQVEIRWPSGRVDRYVGIQPDRLYRLREGDLTPHLRSAHWHQTAYPSRDRPCTDPAGSPTKPAPEDDRSATAAR